MSSRSYALSVALALTGGAAALALPFYGDQILRAPSARAAAPFAAPFALLASSAAAAITLSVVALCDERRL
jgi:adenosylmethionine-8-amino-7-oxononanoate aminotransferase